MKLKKLQELKRFGKFKYFGRKVCKTRVFRCITAGISSSVRLLRISPEKVLRQIET